MALLTETLLLPPETDVRRSVLADLMEYSGLSEAECVERCVHWEKYSVQEWEAADRSTEAGIADFYNTIQSWNFELSWYAYLETEGFEYPANVVVVERVRELGLHPGATALDFGAGVGVTGQLLVRSGFETTIADLSTPLLEFSRFRLERRGDQVKYLNLNDETLPEAAYDVITAIDTLIHVADLPATLTSLHAALKPGGVLFGNYDVRPPSDGHDGNAWHLYHDSAELELLMYKHGLVRRQTLEGSFREYERVELGTLKHRGTYVMRLLRRRVRQGLNKLRRG